MKLEATILRHRVRPFLDEETGATATEYAILLAVLIVGSMGVIRSIGFKFENLYLYIAEAIPDAAS